MPGTKSHHALSQSVADERSRVFEAILKARHTWDREKLAAYTADKRFSELVDLRLAVVTVACLDAKLGK